MALPKHLSFEWKKISNEKAITRLCVYLFATQFGIDIMKGIQNLPSHSLIQSKESIHEDDS
jgi:hypothetical protein